MIDNDYKSVSACVVLINPEGLVLGVSRKNNHNDFGLPGGRMEPEDGSPMVTAYRETLEETGLKISNLRLVFAIHKGGNMGYTYLADYEGEINHNEPHVVKWVEFRTLVRGSFGRYNQLVAESLDDMDVDYVWKHYKKKQ
jgi:8-oxo-dGTP pyrophosphatase MutT (NUDIX family)